MIWLSVLNLKCQSKYSTFSKRSKIHAFVTVSKYFCTFECCEAFLKPFDFKFSQVTEISDIRTHSVFFKFLLLNVKCRVTFLFWRFGTLRGKDTVVRQRKKEITKYIFTIFIKLSKNVEIYNYIRGFLTLKTFSLNWLIITLK